MSSIQKIPVFTDGFFNISSEYGFLPMIDPMIKLPKKYTKIQEILDSFPSYLTDTKKDKLKTKIDNLPNFTTDIKLDVSSYNIYKTRNFIKTIKDISCKDILSSTYKESSCDENNTCAEMELEIDEIMTALYKKSEIVALYRSYCFLASGYLLYPAHVHFKKTGHYGIARDTLPIQLSQPLLFLADELEVKPWLEYSYGYSLGNYVKNNINRYTSQKDVSKTKAYLLEDISDKTESDFDYKNLSMANCFSGTTDETGFIMVHVDINQHTPSLIKNCNNILNYIEYNCVNNINESLSVIYDIIRNINNSRKSMWEASRYSRYNDFRVYIMGITGNESIFPNGVKYEPENTARFYRGQSGSQDSIIPFLDNFFRVCDFYPKNELTDYLMDMRDYRPKPFRDLLSWVYENNQDIIDKLLDTGDERTSEILLKIYKEIYNFRNGHWQFVQKYIMAQTKYPKATGGTGIISWLPNQIKATIEAMESVLIRSEEKYKKGLILLILGEHRRDICKMLELYDRQMKILHNREIIVDGKGNVLKEDYDEKKIYSLNKQFDQNDI